MAAINRMVMIRILIIILVSFSFTACNEKNDELVKRIDHLAIYYNTIHEVDSMIYIFNEVLGLPIWFKPGIREVSNIPSIKFYNSGVYLGNLFLEFITFNNEISANIVDSIKPIFHAFAFTNEMSTTDKILDQREIQRSKKNHFAFNDISGSVDTLFTNITVQELSSDHLLVFFCQYHKELFNCSSFDFEHIPHLTNPEDQHTFYSELFMKKNGGSLKIKNADRIVISSNSYELHKRNINNLLTPASGSNNGIWKITQGPNLQLIEGADELHLEALNVTVESLKNAKEFIDKEDFRVELYESSINLLTLSEALGFDLVLIEKY